MLDSLADALRPYYRSPLTLEEKQRMVQGILAFVEGTPLQPSSYERLLLDQFSCGSLSIDQVILELDMATRTPEPAPESDPPAPAADSGCC